MHHQPASHQHHDRATTSSSQQQPAAACSSQRQNKPVTNRSRTQQPAAAPQQPPSRQPSATHQPPSSQTAASHQPPSTKPAARPRATAGTSPPPAHGRGCIADARTTHLSNARPPPSPAHARATARRRQGHAGREPSYVPAMRTPHLRRIPHVHTGCHPQGPKLTSYTRPHLHHRPLCARSGPPHPRRNIAMRWRSSRNFRLKRGWLCAHGSDDAQSMLSRGAALRSHEI